MLHSQRDHRWSVCHIRNRWRAVRAECCRAMARTEAPSPGAGTRQAERGATCDRRQVVDHVVLPIAGTSANCSKIVGNMLHSCPTMTGSCGSSTGWRWHGCSSASGVNSERRHLGSLLAPGGPAVVFVCGAPGIGKSVLVDAVVAATGRRAIRLDARRVEPTPASFLDMSSAAVDHAAVTAGELGDAMREGDISLLVIDGYERLRLIDDWIRDHLVPALPASSTTVIVTRTPPNAAWRVGEWRQLGVRGRRRPDVRPRRGRARGAANRAW